MKRGSQGLKILCLSLLIMLCVSFVSANFFGDAFKVLFKGTGQVASSSSDCSEYGNYIIYTGQTYYDYCDGNIAYHYSCIGSSTGGIISTSSFAAFLFPLKNSMTGNAISMTGNSVVNPNDVTTTTTDCSAQGKVCIDGGRCGCDPTKTYTCSGSNIGVCKPGAYVCDLNGNLGTTCIGYNGPSTEICTDGKDNNCNGYPVAGSTNDCSDSGCDGQVCATGKICIAGTCTFPQTCTDNDHDGYGNPGNAKCANGPQTDCNDNNPAIHPGATETCNGADDNCDGSIDNGATCGTGQSCISGTCQNNPITSCTDADGDRYSVEANPNTCGNKCGSQTCLGGGDCDDSDIIVHPGATETCNGVDDNCDGSVDNGATCPANMICAGIQGCISTACASNEKMSCTIPGLNGICGQGQAGCKINGQWGSCAQINNATSEVCNNNLDDDCDGFTDCMDPNCESKSCGTEEVCIDNACMPSGPNTNCIDVDHDGYGNPGDLTCSNGVQTDCNDSNANAHPNMGEICNGLDDNCDGSVDNGATCGTGQTCSSGKCQDNSKINPECTDGNTKNCTTGLTGICSSGKQYCSNGQWSSNCLSNSINYQDEICDGVDNNCNGQSDEGITKVIQCQATNQGSCVDHQITCKNTQMQTCEDLNLTRPAQTETCGDGIDNNCDGSVDEGCTCTNGNNQSCNLDDPCKTGEQTCINSIWGNCQEIGTIPDCNTETACTEGALDVCGTNIGICSPGLKTCVNGNWGDCIGATIPTTEICNDGLDNNCNGETDESDCSNTLNITTSTSVGSEMGTTTNEENTQNENINSETGESSTGTENTHTSQETTLQNASWITKLFGWLGKFFQAIFNVGKVIMSGAITATPESHCSDPDGGKNYFQQGIGSAINIEGNEVWFADFCYKDILTTQVDKCAGDNCFLKEYYCNGNNIKYETGIKCQYGCANGACVPDASLTDSCKKFDKVKWEWVNVC
jgi:hypothetical protein